MIVLWEGCHGAHTGPARHVLKKRVGFGIDDAELLTGARRGVKAAVAWVVPHLIGRWYLGNERDQVAVQRVDDLEWPRSGATDQQVLERPEREAATVAIGERVRGIDCSCHRVDDHDPYARNCHEEAPSVQLGVPERLFGTSRTGERDFAEGRVGVQRNEGGRRRGVCWIFDENYLMPRVVPHYIGATCRAGWNCRDGGEGAVRWHGKVHVEHLHQASARVTCGRYITHHETVVWSYQKAVRPISFGTGAPGMKSSVEASNPAHNQIVLRIENVHGADAWARGWRRCR